MTDKTIKLDSNTFIVAVYEWGNISHFRLPNLSRESYPVEYNDGIPTREVLVRVNQAKKLGFEGFVL